MLPGVHDSQGKAKTNKQTLLDYYLKPTKVKMGRYTELLSILSAEERWLTERNHLPQSPTHPSSRNEEKRTIFRSHSFLNSFSIPRGSPASPPWRGRLPARGHRTSLQPPETLTEVSLSLNSYGFVMVFNSLFFFLFPKQEFSSGTSRESHAQPAAPFTGPARLAHGG